MATLTDIRLKVRRVTGLASSNQITDAELDDYINTFYLYDFPEHLRLINLKEVYTFNTQPDIDRYAFTLNSNVSIEGPAYVSGYPIQIFQDRELFFSYYSNANRMYVQTLTTGTGIAGPYAGTITAIPVLRDQRVLISTVDNAGNALSALDDGTGTFVGNVVAGSTINYLTGAIANLTWTGAIAAGDVITVQSINYQAARPQAVLFFNDILQLWPVPDMAYKFDINTYITPTALAAVIDEPVLQEWWQLIAYGAALKIFADKLDMENYGKVNVFFNEQKKLVERRTLKQISINRVSTIYSDDYRFPTPFRSNV